MTNHTTRYASWLCLLGALCGPAAAPAQEALPAAVRQAAPQEVPPLIGTPDEIVFEFGNPRLVVPDGPRKNLTPVRTAQLLADALQRETQRDRRVELLTDLGKTQLDPALPAIRAALGDADPVVRAAAARAAGESLLPELAADLLPLAADTDPIVRAAVVTAHAQLAAGRQEASPAVLAGIADSDMAVRLAAFAAAAEPEAGAVAAQVPALQGRLQLAAVEALGRIGSEAGIEAVLPLLRGNIAQQAAAATALGQMKAKLQAPAVRELLGHEHPTVRRSALAALAALLEADDARATGIAQLSDPDPSVRAVAASMAVPVPDSAVVGRLVECLSDPYLPLHDAALAALEQPANDAVRQQVIDQAVRLLDAPHARRREDGTRLLGAFASNAGLEKQLAIIAQSAATDAIDAAVVRETARALGRIGDRRAAAAVRDLAQRGVAAVMSDQIDNLASGAAVEALVAAAQLGDREVLPTAVRIMRSNPERVPTEPRGAGAWAVGELGGEAADDVVESLLRLARSQYDSDSTRMEAVKTLGRLRAQQAAGQLLPLAEESQTAPMRWMCLWAHARITGQAAAYEPPPIPWRASTAIDDLSAPPVMPGR